MRPGLTAGALGPSIVSLNTNKSSSSSSSLPATLEFWVRFPNERNQGKQAHPVLQNLVPHGSQCVMGRLVHTGLGSSSLVEHVLHYPPPPHANSFVLGTAVIGRTLRKMRRKQRLRQRGCGLPQNCRQTRSRQPVLRQMEEDLKKEEAT